jgi:MFS family permease
MSTSRSLTSKNLHQLRILITSIVTMLIFGLLLWTYSHGGVPSHYILQRKDLPEISNWWGGLLLPILTWFLLGRIKKRLEKQPSETPARKSEIPKVIRLFLIGLAFSILVAVSFTYDYQPFLENVPLILFAISMLIPIYYAEFILGFVLGMTYTFGAVIPTAFVVIVAIVGFLIFQFVRLLFQFGTKLLRKA